MLLNVRGWPSGLSSEFGSIGELRWKLTSLMMSNVRWYNAQITYENHGNYQTKQFQDPTNVGPLAVTGGMFSVSPADDSDYHLLQYVRIRGDKPMVVTAFVQVESRYLIDPHALPQILVFDKPTVPPSTISEKIGNHFLFDIVPPGENTIAVYVSRQLRASAYVSTILLALGLEKVASEPQQASISATGDLSLVKLGNMYLGCIERCTSSTGSLSLSIDASKDEGRISYGLAMYRFNSPSPAHIMQFKFSKGNESALVQLSGDSHIGNIVPLVFPGSGKIDLNWSKQSGGDGGFSLCVFLL